MGKPAAPRKVGEKEALAIGNTIRGSARIVKPFSQIRVVVREQEEA